MRAENLIQVFIFQALLQPFLGQTQVSSEPKFNFTLNITGNTDLNMTSASTKNQPVFDQNFTFRFPIRNDPQKVIQNDILYDKVLKVELVDGNQTFTLNSSNATAFQFDLPKSTGKVAVYISEKCIRPIVFLATEKSAIFSKSGNNLLFQGLDIVNYGISWLNTSLEIKSNENTFLSNFEFQNDQYFVPDITSCLNLFCTNYNISEPNDFTIKMNRFDAFKTQKFVYNNPLIVSNLQTQFTLTPENPFKISIQSLPQTVYWSFKSNPQTQVVIKASENIGSLVIANLETELALKSNNSIVIEFINKGNISSLISVRTSLTKSKSLKWLIYLCVFLGIGLILLVVGGFVLVKRSKKKKFEYPKSPIIANNENLHFQKEEGPRKVFIQNASISGEIFPKQSIAIGDPKFSFPILEIKEEKNISGPLNFLKTECLDDVLQVKSENKEEKLIKSL